MESSNDLVLQNSQDKSTAYNPIHMKGLKLEHFKNTEPGRCLRFKQDNTKKNTYS